MLHQQVPAVYPKAAKSCIPDALPEFAFYPSEYSWSIGPKGSGSHSDRAEICLEL